MLELSFPLLRSPSPFYVCLLSLCQAHRSSPLSSVLDGLPLSVEPEPVVQVDGGRLLIAGGLEVVRLDAGQHGGRARTDVGLVASFKQQMNE